MRVWESEGHQNNGSIPIKARDQKCRARRLSLVRRAVVTGGKRPPTKAARDGSLAPGTDYALVRGHAGIRRDEQHDLAFAVDRVQAEIAGDDQAVCGVGDQGHEHAALGVIEEPTEHT